MTNGIILAKFPGCQIVERWDGTAELEAIEEEEVIPNATPVSDLVGCFRIRLETGWGLEFVLKNGERRIVPTVDRAQAERCQRDIEAFIRWVQNGRG